MNMCDKLKITQIEITQAAATKDSQEASMVQSDSPPSQELGCCSVYLLNTTQSLGCRPNVTQNECPLFPGGLTMQYWKQGSCDDCAKIH